MAAARALGKVVNPHKHAVTAGLYRFRPMACRAGVSGCWGRYGHGSLLDGACAGSPHHPPVLHQRPPAIPPIHRLAHPRLLLRSRAVKRPGKPHHRHCHARFDVEAGVDEVGAGAKCGRCFESLGAELHDAELRWAGAAAGVLQQQYVVSAPFVAGDDVQVAVAFDGGLHGLAFEEEGLVVVAHAYGAKAGFHGRFVAVYQCFDAYGALGFSDFVPAHGLL